MKRTLDLKLKLHCPHNPLLAVFEVYHAMCFSVFSRYLPVKKVREFVK